MEKTAEQIVEELTDLIMEHLETLPPEEREKRIQAVEKYLEEHGTKE
jgi:hypothetical protein